MYARYIIIVTSTVLFRGGTSSFNDQMSSARMLSRLWHRALSANPVARSIGYLITQKGVALDLLFVTFLARTAGGTVIFLGPDRPRGSWEIAPPVGGQMSLTNALPADTCCFANVLVCSPSSVRLPSGRNVAQPRLLRIH